MVTIRSEMKNRMNLLAISAIVLCTLQSVSTSDSCQWPEYLKNSQKTAYSPCIGPESPEILWEARIPGAFDMPPLIVGGNVLTLWKNDLYHLSETRVYMLDLLTGAIVQEVTPIIPEYHIFEVFPVDNKILGTSFRGIYEINFSSKSTLLAEIPKKSHNSKGGQLDNSNPRSTGKVFYYTFHRYPIYLQNTLIFPTDPAVCISTLDFEIIWNLEDTVPELDSHAYELVGDEEVVVFIMENHIRQLIAVDPSTGVLKWKSDHLPLARWLTLGNETVYCGGRTLWAFSRDGLPIWEFVPEEKIICNLVLGPDAVYAADAGHNLYKIGLDGSLVWKAEWEGSPYHESHLVGAGSILYCIENLGDIEVEPTGSQITAYSMEDGSVLWKHYFGDESWVKGPPAVSDGIIVVARASGRIAALCSNPNIFAKQGDAFLDTEKTEKAINSYKKAAELYEQNGDLTRSQEMQKRIDDLESPSASPPETTPTTPQEPSPPISLSLLAFTGTLAGIFIVYFLVKRKRRE